MSYRSSLARARGLGAAKEGVGHWWLQRMTALALVPLVLWVVFHLAVLGRYDLAAINAWIACPPVAVGLICLTVVLFYHSALGVQVVAEDYISTKWRRLLVIISVNFTSVVLTVIAILAVIKILLGQPGAGA